MIGGTKCALCLFEGAILLAPSLAITNQVVADTLRTVEKMLKTKMIDEFSFAGRRRRT